MSDHKTDNTEQRCKNCKFWNTDATQVVSSIGMKFCDGLKDDRIDRPDCDDGSWMYVSTAIVPETVWLHGNHVNPRIATGPEFGCVNFEPRQQ